MLKIVKSSLAIFFITNSFAMEPQQFNLASYANRASSVLPIYTNSNNQQCVILTREARGKDKHTYDDFSGGREPHETHPIQSAAREFWEEAILKETLGWNVEDAENFIDPKRNNTTLVIAYSKDKDPHNPESRGASNVTYMVNFDIHAANMLFNNFYQAIEKEKKRYEALGICRRGRCTLEKDRIAEVTLENLKNAIIHSTDSKNTHVQAKVLDPKTNTFHEEQITLRPFLVSKLRFYFLDMPYKQGEQEKIRHYKVSYQQ